MTKMTKTLIAAAFVATAAMPALADVAAPDTSPVCAPISATVYFAANQTDLSSVAIAALEAQAAQADGCSVSTIEATAISTDGGETLSQARSEAVIAALSDLGIATADTKTSVETAPQGRFISSARTVELTLTSLPDLINS